MTALILIFVLPWIATVLTNTMPYVDKYSGYVISCRTTDMACFKKQYLNLRDHFLMGNEYFGIQRYQPYTFQDKITGNCVQFSGFEASELNGIQMDDVMKEFILILALPFRIQQVKSNAPPCTASQYGTLKNFKGNATIQATYPYTLKMKDDGVHLSLSDENLDIVLDIPDMSHLADSPQHELHEISEWAYTVVQNVDAAKYFALPYTTQIRLLAEFIPLYRLIQLYPDEDYTDLNFKLSRSSICNNSKT